MSLFELNNKKIRFCALLNLIFSFILAGCSGKTGNDPSLAIQWEGNKAVGIVVPAKLLSAIPEDSIDHQLHIYLAGNNRQTPVFGKYTITSDSVLFRPLIAFTRGLKYEVMLAGKLLGEVSIPPADPDMAPAVVNIYPGKDTLPENLLKIHIKFTKPMQEGQVLQHIVLIKGDNDTLRNVFLDLQPELWSNDRTMLTLWLDPGRIKRDLQPNLELGPPLQEGANYRLSILQNWPGAEGISLRTAFHKNFVTAKRDEQSPEIDSWVIHSVTSGSMDKLEVDFTESLDYVLISKAIFIADAQGREIKGTIEEKENETGFFFTPAISWKAGTYTIECESRMEDLAGNNMNRLFDRDLLSKEKHEEKGLFKRTFQIK